MFQLQLEVDRLEELKMQNMKKVIEAIRVEVAQYWDKCFYSQEQRQAFAAYYSGSYRSVTLHAAAHLCFTSADIHWEVFPLEQRHKFPSHSA